VITELGGTIGDIEGQPFVEAMPASSARRRALGNSPWSST
jgi:CTP synthase (UTP-ammonia lyase)